MATAGCQAAAKGHLPALGCTAFASKGAGCSSKLVAKPTHGEIR
jgi:hypothetical protein